MTCYQISEYPKKENFLIGLSDFGLEFHEY